MTREYSKVHTKLEINIEFYTLLLLLDKTVCMTECLFMKEVSVKRPQEEIQLINVL